jgi:hypothetical protein
MQTASLAPRKLSIDKRELQLIVAKIPTKLIGSVNMDARQRGWMMLVLLHVSNPNIDHRLEFLKSINRGKIWEKTHSVA